MRTETQELLIAMGCPMDRSYEAGHKPVSLPGQPSFIMIRSDSEELTEEELEEIRALRQHIAYRFFGQPSPATNAPMANTVTLWKHCGRWTYRHSTWENPMWWQPNVQKLEDIRKDL